MLYAALTFWLLVIVFAAWGVHALWSQMIKPRTVNAVLLPGTLVAQLGHVLGLLVTGNSVQNTSLMGEGDDGEPTSDAPEKTGIPILGSVIVGLLPLVACAIALYVVTTMLGAGTLRVERDAFAVVQVPKALPSTLNETWDLLRSGIAASETLLGAILHSDLMNWRNALFVYLAICLTVRMTPFEGNRRGAIGAILLSGLVIGLAASAIPQMAAAVESSWSVLSFAVGMLVLLLLVSLLVSGVVGLVRVLARNE